MVRKGDRLQLSAEPGGFGFYDGWAERDWRASGTWSNRTREPPSNAAPLAIRGHLLRIRVRGSPCRTRYPCRHTQRSHRAEIDRRLFRAIPNGPIQYSVLCPITGKCSHCTSSVGFSPLPALSLLLSTPLLALVFLFSGYDGGMFGGPTSCLICLPGAVSIAPQKVAAQGVDTQADAANDDRCRSSDNPFGVHGDLSPKPNVKCSSIFRAVYSFNGPPRSMMRAMSRPSFMVQCSA